MAELDGPGLAQLAGLSTRDIASAMGLRGERERLRMQSYRDMVNEMYQKAIVDRMREETRLMEPRLQMQERRAEEAAKGALQKNYEFYKAQVKRQGGIPKGVEAFMRMNDPWVRRYKEYVRQETLKTKPGEMVVLEDFDTWYARHQREGRPTIPQEAERAGAITEARERAKTEEDVLGPGLRNMAEEALQEADALFLAPEGEREGLITGRMEQILIDTFGPSNVSPLLDIPGKGRGWKVRRRDGSVVWKGISK